LSTAPVGGAADASPGVGTPSPEPPVLENDYPFPGKIAIVTSENWTLEEYWSAQYMVEKYGSDKIIHRTWPNYYWYEERASQTFLEIAEDPEVRALILNQAAVGSNAAIDALLEFRDDIFIVYCNPAENPVDVTARANLLIGPNDALRGEKIVTTAKLMGAEVFAHYSFPRHLGMSTIAARREQMIAACEREGILFVDLPAPDPTGPDGTAGMWYIREDVPRQVAEYGKNIAFFGTNCAMQSHLQWIIIQEGAIYPEPCCPSPYHAFPVVLEVTEVVYDGSFMGVDAEGNPEVKPRLRYVSEFIGEMRSNVAAIGATGRLAVWPVPASMMLTAVGTEYAIKWINGEVPRERGIIDYAVFEEICEAYIYETVGEHLGVELNPFFKSGRAYYNYLLVIPDSFIF